MRNALPIALILLAVAVGAWILLSSEEEPEPGAFGSYDDPGSSDDPDLLTGGGLKGSGPEPRKGPDRRPYKPIDPRKVPRGTLDVAPVGPDLAPIPNRHLRIYVEPTTRKDWTKQLGQYDDETGVWTFKNVLAGEVEVRLFGDHVIATKQKAEVSANGRSRVQIHVELAGAVLYQVKLRDGTEPKDVKVTLFNLDDEPIAAYHESRSARRITTPRVAKTSVQGPRGAVFGVPAGSYRLRVDTDDHGYVDTGVAVQLSETAEVKVELGR